MLDFTAIDFETANEHWGSPCAVGLVKVRDGREVDAVSWLMRPPARYSRFDDVNIGIHGITPQKVRRQPTFARRLPQIVDFIGDDIAVAHNAHFDSNVIRYACANDGLVAPDIPFLCTLRLARRALSLENYRLPTVIRGVGAELGRHHDPLADARGVVTIIVELAKRDRLTNLLALAEIYDVGIAGPVAGRTGARGAGPAAPRVAPAVPQAPQPVSVRALRAA